MRVTTMFNYHELTNTLRSSFNGSSAINYFLLSIVKHLTINQFSFLSNCVVKCDNSA